MEFTIFPKKQKEWYDDTELKVEFINLFKIELMHLSILKIRNSILKE